MEALRVQAPFCSIILRRYVAQKQKLPTLTCEKSSAPHATQWMFEHTGDAGTLVTMLSGSPSGAESARKAWRLVCTCSLGGSAGHRLASLVAGLVRDQMATRNGCATSNLA